MNDVIKKAWAAFGRMKSRCYNHDDKSYNDYGGRGIYVSNEWLKNPQLFYKWYVDRYFDGCQIDRIDNDGSYSEENCRLVDRRTNNNNRRNTLYVEAFGERKPLTYWLEDDRCYENDYYAIYQRLELGVPPEIAMSKDYAKYRGDKIGRTKRDRAKQYKAFGESKSLKDWSEDERCVVVYKTLWGRVRSGWSIEDAITKKSR